MWLLIVPIAFLYSVSSSRVDDLSQLICENAAIGDFVPNPRDCSSYFICGTVPLISYCDTGLYFDAEKKNCNWPKLAKCQISQHNSENDHDTLNQMVQIPSTTSGSRAELKLIDKVIPHEPSPAPQPPLSFTALDVNTLKSIDPMTNYNPENMVCQHYGAYFVPHPADCTAYYVCAFGHLLQHKCGRGSGWSYKRQMCEASSLAECYVGATEPKALIELIDIPPKTGVYTVCYLMSNGIAGPSTWMSQPTTDVSSSPIESVGHPSTIATVSSTGRANAAVLAVPNCPKNDEAYLPHSVDCSKYYICIIGMPVLTSCPEGLYWDQKAEVCDLFSKVDCPQN